MAKKYRIRLAEERLSETVNMDGAASDCGVQAVTA